MCSLDAGGVMAAVEHVLSSPHITSHVAKMAAIVRSRKESPAKVSCPYSERFKMLLMNDMQLSAGNGVKEG